LQFSTPTFSVNESGPTATITVSRSGGNSAVGVTYATTSGGTATSGSDYTAVTNNLSWANGDTANKTFTIPIVNDSVHENNETVNLTLSNPTGGAMLGNPATAVLTIVDNDPAAGGSYTISGRITNASNVAMQNVSVTRTGSNTAVLTNSAGYFTFTNVPAGTYTLTPSLSGYGFTPGTRSVTVTSANVSGQNFVASTGYTIMGRISNTSGVAIPNVSVSRTGSANAVLTNSAGYFTFTSVPAGSYTITPSLADYGFTPGTRSVTITNANVTGQNYVGSQGYTITGRIATSGGTGIANISVTRTGSANAVLTNSAGYFTFNSVPNGSYTITPSKSGMSFTPTSKNVVVNGANVAGQNFIGT
jgi:uncharacterized protein (UPF0264 family)